MARVRTEEHKAWQRQYAKDKRKRRRQQAIEHLGCRCVRCGSNGPFEIDHVDRHTKSFSVSSPPSEAAFWQELKKCQLQCYDCHRDKSGYEMSGEHSPNAKLTNLQVFEIRRRLTAGETGASLAREFGVGPMQISRIKNGHRWKRLQ